jgi:ubiquitin carboxyl-terminal hydrolase 8
LEYTKARESFILRLFYGQIKSTVKCTTCYSESATYETFSNLSLELPPSNIDQCHISECFDMYFHGEKVYGWNCPNCKEPREAIKKLDISKLPPVLVIHLKRFYADPYMNSTFRKKTISVDFPLIDMNMMPYVARSEKNNGSNSQHNYNLYAVSNHYGGMDCGHYTGNSIFNVRFNVNTHANFLLLPQLFVVTTE